MAHMTVMPRGVGQWTVDDLDGLPDDGLQYELLDGMLLVTPAPVPLHQRAVGRLHVLLHGACPPDLEVLLAPLDWQPHDKTSLQPDLLVIRGADFDPRRLTPDLLLAVEVLSPSTRRKDRVTKRSAYEDGGIESYWIVDPDEPSIVALDLIDGRYEIAGEAHAEQSLTLRHPFEVTVVPTDLVGC